VRVAALLACVLALTMAAPVAAEEPEGVAAAARVFGAALTEGRPAAMRRILPDSGKVRLCLARLGPEKGAFGPPQVEALFRDYLDSAAVLSFEVGRVAGDPRAGTAHARLALRDPQGRQTRIGLHLAFQREEGRWVLRGIEETPE
jgi:hypothetical protein